MRCWIKPAWGRGGWWRHSLVQLPGQQQAKRNLFVAANTHTSSCRRSVWFSYLHQSPRAQQQWSRGPNALGAVRNMFVQTKATPNPLSLQFIPFEKQVLDENVATGVEFTPGCDNIRRSPLAKQLFDIGGITRIFYGKNFISITKEEDEEWETLKPIVFATIIDFYETGEPVLHEHPIVTDTTILDDDDEVVAMIKELLESRIRPSVQEDGGDIFYRGFDAEHGLVQVQLAGSCAGCPSSSITLKNGVENMLMHYIPEVKGILEVTADATAVPHDVGLKQLSVEDFVKAT